MKHWPLLPKTLWHFLFHLHLFFLNAGCAPQFEYHCFRLSWSLAWPAAIISQLVFLSPVWLPHSYLSKMNISNQVTFLLEKKKNVLGVWLTTTYRIKSLFLSMAYKVLGSVPVSLLSLISTHCHHPLHHTTLTFPLTYWHLPRFILLPLLFPLLDMLFLSLWVCLSYFILQGPSINVINPLCLPQLSPSPLRD